MSRGFFNSSQTKLDTQPVRNITGCGACGLNKTCNTPKMGHTGKGKKRILILTEAPTKFEDSKGKPLLGPVGQRVKQVLRKYGIDLHDDCWTLPALRCAPPSIRTSQGMRQRRPTGVEVEACRPAIMQFVREHKPHIIIALGTTAIMSSIGGVWRGGIESDIKWRGWQVPLRDYGCFVCPTMSVDYLLKQEEKNPAAGVILRQDIHAALKLLTTPFPEYRDEEKDVELVMDERRLVDLLTPLARAEMSCFAFDYETTGLKPHKQGHRIVSMSIAQGERDCFAFMMPNHDRRLIGLIKRVLQNKATQKMAHNMAFEDNWSRVLLGAETANWYWDSMQAAHVLDNRRGISALKFQAFVNFGVVDYNSHLAHFLYGIDNKDKNSLNRIDAIPVHDLLIYNGLDSIYEFMLAQKQMRQAGGFRVA